jgi:hypothetical protein
VWPHLFASFQQSLHATPLSSRPEAKPERKRPAFGFGAASLPHTSYHQRTMTPVYPHPEAVNFPPNQRILTLRTHFLGQPFAKAKQHRRGATLVLSLSCSRRSCRHPLASCPRTLAHYPRRPSRASPPQPDRKGAAPGDRLGFTAAPLGRAPYWPSETKTDQPALTATGRRHEPATPATTLVRTA